MPEESGQIAAMLRPLVAAIQAKKGIGEPYVLCLGEGATLSSGCRAMRWAVREIVGQERPAALDEVLSDLGRPERCGGDSDCFQVLLRTLSEEQWYVPLLRAFFELLDQRRGLERKQLLSHFLEEEYPSPGYEFLAILAREGFFDVILNANYDPLLQRALDAHLPSTDPTGRPVQPYERLVNRADPGFKREIEDALRARTPRLKAIWLHGHLWERSGIAFTPPEKRTWYPNVKDAVEKLFGQDLLLVGYTDRDADIRLAIENAAGGGTIWYVAPEKPGLTIINALLARQHQVISGPAGEFDRFCQALFDLLLDLGDPQHVQQGESHRRELLDEKRVILDSYVWTLKRRRDDDPQAPAALDDLKAAVQREVQAIDDRIAELQAGE